MRWALAPRPSRPDTIPCCRDAQLPSAAANPRGPYLPHEVTEHRPSLHSEFGKLRLEQALDAALQEARDAKGKGNDKPQA